MENIDLTLEGLFTSERKGRRFDDEERYSNALDYKDQRRAKTDILGIDDYIFKFLGITLEKKEYLTFFGDTEKNELNRVKEHETIYDITGIMTEDLKQEYDSGFGSENICDCCGGFISEILNKDISWLCDNCAKTGKYRNEHFWEDKKPTFDNWID